MLISLASLKAELSITDTSQDLILTGIIDQTSSLIESYCHRTFGVRQITETMRFRRCHDLVMLKAHPVISISEIIENDAELSQYDYEISDSDAGLISRLDGFENAIWWSAGKISVTYKAGYNLPDQMADPDADALPEDIKRCCLDLCVSAYFARGRDQSLRSISVQDVASHSWVDPDKIAMRGGIPDYIASRLDHYRTMVIA